MRLHAAWRLANCSQQSPYRPAHVIIVRTGPDSGTAPYLPLQRASLVLLPLCTEELFQALRPHSTHQSTFSCRPSRLLPYSPSAVPQ